MTFSGLRFSSLLRAAASLGLMLLAGCMTKPSTDAARNGPFFTPVNHSGDPQLPASLRRVVVLPVCGGQVARAESVVPLDAVFVSELEKYNRFEVVTLSRADCLEWFQLPEISSTAALPHDFMAVLQRRFGADAVMFIDLTVYRAYPPLALGVRAKLATLGNVRLVWTFDNVFSTSDPTVANSARHHFLNSNRRGVPADFTTSVLQSPTRFAAYVAWETFGTLPPVYAPRIQPPGGKR
jgi:hypothetical protein